MYPSDFKIHDAHRLFRSGLFKEALEIYLEIARRNPPLYSSILINMELCARRIEEAGESVYFEKNPSFFRFGTGFSEENGLVYFDNSYQRSLKSCGLKKDKDFLVEGGPRIVFISDSNPSMNPERKIWGAENSASFIIKHGLSKGFTVNEIDQYNFDENTILGADLLVLRSIAKLDIRQTRFIENCIYEKLIPYVTYQHDYGFCGFRNSIRCDGNLNSEHCKKCLNSCDKYSNGRVFNYARLIKSSKLNIFISHPQRHIFGRVFGGCIDPSVVILPAIDPQIFENKNLSRDNSLIVNTSGKLNSPNKGFSNLVNFINLHPEFRYELYTETNQEINNFIKNKNNVKLFSPVDLYDLPFIYSRAHGLIALPSVMEPCGRTPVEAALCGCNTYLNSNMGVSFFKLPLDNAAALSNLLYKSVDSLWNRLMFLARNHAAK